jgi:hypothetical protein
MLFWRSDKPKCLWWCPTSLLVFMPVHAVGLYGTHNSPNVSDFAISSYIPTLDTLITAQSQPWPAERDKVLIIIQPKTPGQRPLHYTVAECDCIKRVVPPASFLQLHESSTFTTDGSDATVENDLLRLPDASIVHFACHGVQAQNPLESAVKYPKTPTPPGRSNSGHVVPQSHSQHSRLASSRDALDLRYSDHVTPIT